MKDITETLEEFSGEFIVFTLIILTLITVSILVFFAEAMFIAFIAIASFCGIMVISVVFPEYLGKLADRIKPTEETDEKKLREAMEGMESKKAQEEGKGVDGVHNAVRMG